jgi:predicted enzyme related to lactoylglutathione lyase
MGERTSHPPGTFSWVELSTSDAGAAKAFYSALFGWELDDRPAGPDMTYTMALLHGSEVAAMYQQGEREQGVPPHWNSYVTVESADAAAARGKELGGNLLMEPFDVMDVGRMAVVQDPQGATIFVWEPRSSIGARRVNDPGCLTWNDLNTTDPGAAEHFYAGLFGWSFERVQGDFEYWLIRKGERSNGGMRRQDQEQEVAAGVPPNWMPYFTVEAADDAVTRIGELGGSVIVPPRQVPTGRFAVVRDPQNAVFALFEGERDD